MDCEKEVYGVNVRHFVCLSSSPEQILQHYNTILLLPLLLIKNRLYLCSAHGLLLPAPYLITYTHLFFDDPFSFKIPASKAFLGSRPLT